MVVSSSVVVSASVVVVVSSSVVVSVSVVVSTSDVVSTSVVVSSSVVVSTSILTKRDTKWNSPPVIEKLPHIARPLLVLVTTTFAFGATRSPAISPIFTFPSNPARFQIIWSVTESSAPTED